MRSLTRNFVQGLLVVAPLGLTVWIVWVVVRALDNWLVPGDDAARFPGLGLLIAVLGITLVGYLTRNVLGRKIGEFVTRILQRIPIVKLLYNSFRDLLGAFAGDRRGFQKPVVAEVSPNVKIFGFMTCQAFDDPQLSEHVSVYCPQSYNFAGNMIVVPRAKVRALDAESAQLMAFILSGGVTAMSAAKTVTDSPRAKLT